MSLPTTSSNPQAAETETARPKGKLAGRIFLAVVVVLLLATVPLTYRAYRLRGIPNSPEPFDLDEAGFVVIAPGDNAFEWYSRAVTAMRPMSGSVSLKFDKSQLGTWEEVDADVRKEIAANRPAVDLYRQGADRPNAVCIQPRDLTYSTSLSVVQELRSLTRIVRLEAMRLEAEGDREGAWELHRAILRTGQNVGRHGCFMEWMVGTALQAIGLESAARWAENPKNDAELLRSALKDVLALRTTLPPASNAVKAEYLAFRNMTATLRTPEGWEAMDLHLLPSASGKGWSRLEYTYGLLQGEPEISQRVGRIMWINWLSQVDLPRLQRTAPGSRGPFPLNPALPRTANLYSDTEIGEWLPRAKVAQQFAPAIGFLMRSVDIRMARQGLLELTLALQLYSREHDGAYPDALEGLTPKYLAKIPADTFGKGESLRYRRESSPVGFTVWSIGPDEVDDLGKKVFTGSTGDIVVRLPYQRPPEEKE